MASRRRSSRRRSTRRISRRSTRRVPKSSTRKNSRRRLLKQKPKSPVKQKPKSPVKQKPKSPDKSSVMYNMYIDVDASDFNVEGKDIYNSVTKKIRETSYNFGDGLGNSMKPYRLIIPYRHKTLEKVYDVPQTIKDVEVCKGMYETDPASMVDFKDYEQDEYEDIYIGDRNECFSLSSILHKIENGFVSFDTESRRILPLYPSDFNNLPLPPHVFRSIVKTALKRGMNVQKEYPISYLFYNEPTNLLEAVYAFITQYRNLTDYFMNKNDDNAAIQRDIIAIKWLSFLYMIYNIYDLGYRKYVDIESTNSHSGTQIFYQALMVSYLLAKNFVIRERAEGDYYWGKRSQKDDDDKPVTYRDRPIVRRFVSYKVIHKY